MNIDAITVTQRQPHSRVSPHIAVGWVVVFIYVATMFSPIGCVGYENIFQMPSLVCDYGLPTSRL